MNAKKEAQTIQGTKQEFLKIFREMCYARNAWQVWEDLISAIACSLANSTDPDKTNVQYKEREREYAQCIKRLGGVDKPAKCFAIMVEALERDPPYHICDFMAKITEGNIDGEIEKKGFISIFDPACGAGATLIAAANNAKKAKHNFQNHILFVGQDIDRIVGMMCYIQLSLLGCAGYICIGNTLTNPMEGHALFPQEKEGQEFWYMPMFRMEVWSLRRKFHCIESMSAQTKKKEEKLEKYYLFFDFKKEETQWEKM